MKSKDTGINLSRYWPFWGLHFGFHVIMGIVANIAGVVVIITQGAIISGAALVGAGIFSLVNGWQGFIELRNSGKRRMYMT